MIRAEAQDFDELGRTPGSRSHPRSALLVLGIDSERAQPGPIIRCRETEERRRAPEQCRQHIPSQRRRAPIIINFSAIMDQRCTEQNSVVIPGLLQCMENIKAMALVIARHRLEQRLFAGGEQPVRRSALGCAYLRIYSCTKLLNSIAESAHRSLRYRKNMLHRCIRLPHQALTENASNISSFIDIIPVSFDDKSIICHLLLCITKGYVVCYSSLKLRI